MNRETSFVVVKRGNSSLKLLYRAVFVLASRTFAEGFSGSV